MWVLIKEPWPWYVAGPIIAIVYFLLTWFGNNFGISATLRTQCSILGAGKKVKFFDFDWKSQSWNLVFVLGALLGGFIAANFMQADQAGIQLAESTKEALSSYGMTSQENSFYPTEIFAWDHMSWKHIIVLVVGGILVGFGTRYAGGCTSGHAISGLANLQLPSLIAVIGFFIGGLIMTFGFLPYILTWLNS